MNYIHFPLFICALLAITLSSVGAVIYIPMLSFIVHKALRYVYKPAVLKDRPKWMNEARGTAIMLLLALLILHALVLPTMVMLLVVPFGTVAINLIGMLLMTLMTGILVACVVASIGKAFGATGEFPRKYIVTPAGHVWIGVGPIFWAVLKTLGLGVLEILKLPYYLVMGFIT